MLLEGECEKTGHASNVIHQANDTRWDTRHLNMSDVVYYEQCLLSLAAKGKLRIKKKGEPAYSLVPSPEEFRMIKGGIMVFQHCKTFTKIMEQEKVATLPLVTQSLYDMEQEMKRLVTNKDTDEVAREFCEAFMQNLFSKRFPNYGTENELNSFGNYLNPSCQGVHLKVVNKFESTKIKLEEKLGEWKKEESESENENTQSSKTKRLKLLLTMEEGVQCSVLLNPPCRKKCRAMRHCQEQSRVWINSTGGDYTRSSCLFLHLL